MITFCIVIETFFLTNRGVREMDADAPHPPQLNPQTGMTIASQ
jgi:hypothetical protein